jgi:Zn-dependent membrane protease YugP
MYFEDYILFLVALLACMIFAGWASRKVKTSYTAFATVKTRTNMTGYDTAVRLLRANGVTDIAVNRVKGTLTDHYHPTKKVVNLSQSTYGDNSVAAVAVAAHEIGHVMQNKAGYLPYRIRTALVPVANFGSVIAIPLVLIGVLLEIFLGVSGETSVGFVLALVGVAFYGAATLFQLVTLPVELNASKRAMQMLLDEGILEQGETAGAKKVLSAAALTYLAGLITSLVYFFRFFLWVLTIFGRRRR